MMEIKSHTGTLQLRNQNYMGTINSIESSMTLIYLMEKGHGVLFRSGPKSRKKEMGDLSSPGPLSTQAAT